MNYVHLQAAGLAGVTAAFFAFHLTVTQALGIVVAVMFVVVGDQVRDNLFLYLYLCLNIFCCACF